MKITSIDLHHLRYEYPNAHGFRYAGGICTSRLSSVVEVHTDTGHSGLGSCYTHPALAEIVVKQQLEPMLVGREATHVESLWKIMYGLTRWYGRKGGALSALGALDMAFWDLKGKESGLPVWKLLGGSRAFCPAYASALLWDEPAAMAAEARRHVDNGFRRMKMRMGQGENTDMAAVRAIRAEVGPDIDLMVDAGMRLRPETARRIAAELAASGVFWFEEPFEPENLEAYAALRGTVDVPIAAGENEFGVQGFRELIERRAVDIVQPDVSRCGGVSETWKVAQMAAQAGLRVATHSWSDAIAIIGNAHVIAASSAGLTVEIDQTGNALVDDLLQQKLLVTNGILGLSEAPGFGIELNREALHRYRMDDAFAIPPGRYSDMVFGAGQWTPAGDYREAA